MSTTIGRRLDPLLRDTTAPLSTLPNDLRSWRPPRGAGSRLASIFGLIVTFVFMAGLIRLFVVALQRPLLQLGVDLGSASILTAWFGYSDEQRYRQRRPRWAPDRIRIEHDRLEAWFDRASGPLGARCAVVPFAVIVSVRPVDSAAAVVTRLALRSTERSLGRAWREPLTVLDGSGAPLPVLAIVFLTRENREVLESGIAQWRSWSAPLTG